MTLAIDVITRVNDVIVAKAILYLALKRKMSKRRIVVTGLGVVSSLGIGRDEFWKSITSGKSGISRVSSLTLKNSGVIMLVR